MDGDADLLRRPLDHHLGNAGLSQAATQEVVDLEVLVQVEGVFLLGVPAGVPGTVDAQPEADRIDLLTHHTVSLRSRTTSVMLLNGFSIRPVRPRARARNRFITSALPTEASAT